MQAKGRLSVLMWTVAYVLCVMIVIVEGQLPLRGKQTDPLSLHFRLLAFITQSYLVLTMSIHMVKKSTYFVALAGAQERTYLAGQFLMAAPVCQEAKLLMKILHQI